MRFSFYTKGNTVGLWLAETMNMFCGSIPVTNL